MWNRQFKGDGDLYRAEVRILKKKNITLTSSYDWCVTYETRWSDPVSFCVFAARAQIRLVLTHIRFEYAPFVICTRVPNLLRTIVLSTGQSELRVFLLHISVHFLLRILFCSSGQSSCSNWILLNHGVLNVKWQIFWKWENRQGEAQRHQLAGNRYSHWGNTRKSE